MYVTLQRSWLQQPIVKTQNQGSLTLPLLLSSPSAKSCVSVVLNLPPTLFCACYLHSL